jgi:hypothetical protein
VNFHFNFVKISWKFKKNFNDFFKHFF